MNLDLEIDSSDDEYTIDINDQESSFNKWIVVIDTVDLAEMCKFRCGKK